MRATNKVKCARRFMRAGPREIEEMDAAVRLMDEARKVDPEMTLKRCRLLIHIANKGRVLQCDLPELIAGPDPSVSRNLKELERRLLISVQKAPGGDKRKNIITITPLGLRRVREWIGAMELRRYG